MGQHYSKDVTAVSAWCNVCKKTTMHLVSGKKKTHCLVDHHANDPKPAKKIEKKQEGFKF